MAYRTLMARRPNENESARLYIRPSVQVVRYLDQLARIGIHGTTRSEVAKTLVSMGIERLVREGLVRVDDSTHPNGTDGTP